MPEGSSPVPAGKGLYHRAVFAEPLGRSELPVTGRVQHPSLGFPQPLSNRVKLDSSRDPFSLRVLGPDAVKLDYVTQIDS